MLICATRVRPILIFCMKPTAGGRLNIKIPSYQYRDPMFKIRRSHDRLIFNMGNPIPGKTVFILERALDIFVSSFLTKHSPRNKFLQSKSSVN